MRNLLRLIKIFEQNETFGFVKMAKNEQKKRLDSKLWQEFGQEQNLLCCFLCPRINIL